VTIELIVIPALVFFAVAMTVKLIERRRDVLYGPYIQGRRSRLAEMRHFIKDIMAAPGLHKVRL
jgi:hypothetical protein